MVIPRAFSSGALSIWSYAFASPPYFFDSTRVSAAVSVVLPWSTCPIVPTFTCGLVRSNFPFAMIVSFDALFLVGTVDDRVGHALRRFGVVLKFHRVGRAPLRERAQRRRITEHLRERHFGLHQLDASGL